MFKALLTRVVLALGIAWAATLPAARAQQFDFSKGMFGRGRDASSSEVTLKAEFAAATSERPALLFVTAEIADGFHLYAIDQDVLPNGGGGPMATQIHLAKDAAARVIGPWQPLQPPHTHVDQEIWTGLELREHDKQVTWFAPVEMAAGALTIAGQVTGQACNPQTCIPFDQPFTAKLGDGIALPPGTDIHVEVATAVDATPSPTTSPTASLSTPSESVSAGPAVVASGNSYDISQINLEQVQNGSLIKYLVMAFLGGIILNVMPCVLPVIGLKVMSFVHQAGQSRAHALALNCWYAAGIVTVFLVLAGLAITLQLGWGGQFGSAQFNITLIGVVFAMALSLLGIWEIPIPGFVGSGTAINAAEREGPAAAFLKGVLTTLLATPCTGPFMATALAWAVKQPAWTTFSVFGVLGLGMASPYLVIGAFPSLIRFLPKPGAWMETFKKIMGLVMLATVVWLMTFIDFPLAVPTVAMMVGIAAACWWVSQTPITAPTRDKAYSWVTAVLLTTVVAMGSYGWLYLDVMLPRFEKTIAHAAGTDDQNWQRFSRAKLGQLTLGEGRTVMVDFTADWCLTCKTLEKLVLKTQPVEEAIAKAKVITMEADYTKRPEAIDQMIKSLGGIGVPLIAIFPGSDPYHPIVFSDGQYTQSGLIDAIDRAAGQSNSGAGTALSQIGGGDPRL